MEVLTNEEREHIVESAKLKLEQHELKYKKAMAENRVYEAKIIKGYINLYKKRIKDFRQLKLL